MAINKQMALVDEELEQLDKYINHILEQIASASSMEHYLEEIKRLEMSDLECTRVLLHDVIKKITLTDQHLENEYHYDFGG